LDGGVVARVPIEGPDDDVNIGLMEEGLPNVGGHDINNCIREGRAESITRIVAGFLVCNHSGLIGSGRVIASILIIRGEVRCR
jgi:hypothetical protein